MPCPRRQESVAVALPVATRGVEARSGFLVRTYLHLYAAIVAFTLIEAFLFVTGLARLITIGMLSTSWLVVLGSFVASGAPPSSRWSASACSRGWCSGRGRTSRSWAASCAGAFAVALMLIVAATVFGFQMGPIFSVAMVGLAGAAILYDTSKVLHHYPEDRYVAAALELFASVALMFWYVLRLFLASRR